MTEIWKIPKFLKSDNPHGLVSESCFSVLFPKYRELYLRTNWNAIKAHVEKYDVGIELDPLEGTLTVRTTNKTWDPYIIMKAKDVIKLLARSVPYEEALKVLDDEYVAEIIKISSFVSNKERFVKRRERLIGQDDSTLKALQLLTNTYICVKGNTVSVIGSYAGLKEVRKIVEDTMKNIHPIYNIKALMIKKELLKDDKLSNEDWKKFLPTFKKLKPKKKTLKKKKVKKPYTPFPPPQLPSKIDMEIETGEYFVKEALKKRNNQITEKKNSLKQKKKDKKRDMKQNIPPIEEPIVSTLSNPDTQNPTTNSVDVKKLKSKLKKRNLVEG